MELLESRTISDNTLPDIVDLEDNSSLPLLAEGEQWSGLMVTHVKSSSWHFHNVRTKFVWYGSYLMVNHGRA